MRLVAELPIDLRIEENVAFHVRRKPRRAGLIDLTRDSLLCGEAMADEVASGFAERRDEHQLVLMARRHLAEWIIEKNRSRFRRDEFVRFLEDLAQNEIEVDLALKRQTASVPLEKPLELRDFQRMKLNHCHGPAEIIGVPRARPRMPRFPAKF